MALLSSGRSSARVRRARLDVRRVRKARSEGRWSPFGHVRRGEMAERFNAAVLKTAVPETVPWVRIPLSPDVFTFYEGFFGLDRPAVAVRSEQMTHRVG